MGALTRDEREGLENVFLSIHSNEGRYQKLRNISVFIMIKNRVVNPKFLFKRAKKGLKATKFLYLIAKLSKKKKFLSK